MHRSIPVSDHLNSSPKVLLLQGRSLPGQANDIVFEVKRVELITYLNENFYTQPVLLNYAKMTENELAFYQQQRVMPKCSYKLKVNLSCDSFFGPYTETQNIEYYAKGYVSWLSLARTLKSPKVLYSHFADRYKEEIAVLKTKGHTSTSAKISTEIDAHIQQEWQHFLDGVYGLCTATGLPEDIAAKEFAILEINELSSFSELSDEQTIKLARAVNLLDSTSSLFAPHERPGSSRHRLIDEIRRKYQLQCE